MKPWLFRLFSFFSFILSGISVKAQTPGEKFKFIKQDITQSIDCYKTGVCNKIKFPKEYEAACLVALSHYPELKNEQIEFVYGKGAYSMAARPVPFTLLLNKKHRKYRIFINTESKNSGLLLPQVGFNAQVGIIGHELAHILDYSQKSSFRIICDGLGYLSKGFRAKYEKETDRIAIDRGLGWQLHEFSSKTQEDKNVPNYYKVYKVKTYMSPQSILNYIETQNRRE
jgi:hypothetical protein